MFLNRDCRLISSARSLIRRRAHRHEDAGRIAALSQQLSAQSELATASLDHHRREIAALHEQHCVALERARAEHEARERDAAQRHKADAAAARVEFDRLCDEQRQRAATEAQAAAAELCDERRRAVESQAEWARAVDEARRGAESEADARGAAHAAELECIQTAHATRIDELLTAHANQIESMRHDHSVAAAAAEREWSARIESASQRIASAEREAQALRAAVAAAEQQSERHRAEAVALSGELEALLDSNEANEQSRRDEVKEVCNILNSLVRCLVYSIVQPIVPFIASCSCLSL